MSARPLATVVALLVCAYGAWYACAELLAWRFDGPAQDTASAAAQLAALPLFSVAIAFAARTTGAFAGPERRTAITIAAAATVIAVVPWTGLALEEVATPLLGSLSAETVGWRIALVTGMAALAVIIWGTVRVAHTSAVVAMATGLWVGCGAFITYAGIDSLLHPANAQGGGLDSPGENNGFAVWLWLMAYAGALAIIAAGQLVTLFVNHRISARHQPPVHQQTTP